MYFMAFEHLGELLELLGPIFKELNFKESEGGIMLRDDFAIKIDYDEDASLINLKGAKAQEGEQLEFITLSQYLFDSTHSSRDLKAVALDFEDTLRSELGEKKTVERKRVALPTRAAAGETPTIEAFTKGFLDIFPQYRDAYRDMLSEQGSFLYVDFYKTYGVEKMLELASGKGTDKQLGKYLTFLGKYYAEGDKYVVAVITSVIFAGSFYNNRALFDEVVAPRIKDIKYLNTAAVNAVDYAAKSKKLQAVFAK